MVTKLILEIRMVWFCGKFHVQKIFPIVCILFIYISNIYILSRAMKKFELNLRQC